jgi:uncharacterized protein YgiB involved in biofilm formation
MKRTRTLNLTLLAAAATSLAACSPSAPVSEYQRLIYTSYAQCMNDYRLIPELERPCVLGDQGYYYGPYYYGTGTVHYLGYSPAGVILTHGVVYNTVQRTRIIYQEPKAMTLTKSAPTRRAASTTSNTAETAHGEGSATSHVAAAAAGAAAATVASRAGASRTTRGGFGSSTRSSGSFGG